MMMMRNGMRIYKNNQTTQNFPLLNETSKSNSQYRKRMRRLLILALLLGVIITISQRSLRVLLDSTSFSSLSSGGFNSEEIESTFGPLHVDESGDDGEPVEAVREDRSVCRFVDTNQLLRRGQRREDVQEAVLLQPRTALKTPHPSPVILFSGFPVDAKKSVSMRKKGKSKLTVSHVPDIAVDVVRSRSITSLSDVRSDTITTNR